MDLLEYQAKELFRSVGIPVLPSQTIDHPRELKHLTIPYPVVLKSQVYMGGRGRMGGIRFVENTIDAVAAAHAIFALPIMGEYPQTLLAEAKYNAEQEFYLAVVLNRSIRRPVLLGSMRGGVDVQSAVDHMQQVVVDGEFSPFYARRLALKMGLHGSLMKAVSHVIENMYWLFVENDLDLVEINPLGVDQSGKVMALDGKITANDSALARNPGLAALSQKPIDHTPVPAPELQMTMDTEGDIALLCNGSGLTMATMDWVYQAGGKPVCFFNLGSETQYDWSSEQFCQRLSQGLAQMLQLTQVRVILVNLVSGTVPLDRLATTLLEVWKRTVRPSPSRGQRDAKSPMASTACKLVVRLAAVDRTIAQSLLAHPDVSVYDDLEAAIAATVSSGEPTNA
jgi:succinyl-CoA synthetase beta subunit